MTKENKKEGLLTSVKNITDKNEELLKEIKNQRTKNLGNKDKQTVKTNIFLIYDQNHNFYKYRLHKFSSISSIESKFDMLDMFYWELISLKSLKAGTKENTYHNFVVINNA